jgi:hypothetical protein
MLVDGTYYPRGYRTSLGGLIPVVQWLGFRVCRPEELFFPSEYLPQYEALWSMISLSSRTCWKAIKHPMAAQERSERHTCSQIFLSNYDTF